MPLRRRECSLYVTDSWGEDMPRVVTDVFKPRPIARAVARIFGRELPDLTKSTLIKKGRPFASTLRMVKGK